MNNESFDELAGRIEGVGRALMGLVAELSEAEVISAPRYCRRVRGMADALDFPAPHIDATKRTIRELAGELERVLTPR